MIRVLSLLTVFLTLATIAAGTYVRSVDVGVGCPEWPGCFGRPLAVWELAMPNRGTGPPAAVAKPQVDISLHRVLAGAVGLCILLLSALVWTLKRNRMRAAFLSLAGMTMVILQSLLGMWALEQGMPPIAIAAHLLLGFAILALLFLLHLNLTPRALEPSTSGTRFLAMAALLFIVVQIAAGGWVSANQAGLACPDFPGCLGRVWPDADFRSAFTAGHKSHDEAPDRMLPLPARASIHWLHRVGGLVAYLLITFLAFLLSLQSRSMRLRTWGVALVLLVSLQAAAGIALILLRMPIVLEIAHSVLAGVLLLVAIGLWARIGPPRHRDEMP